MRAVVAKAPEPGAADSAARKAHVQLQGVRHNGRVVRASAEHVWPVAPAEYSALIPLLQRQVLCVDTTASTPSTLR